MLRLPCFTIIGLLLATASAAQPPREAVPVMTTANDCMFIRAIDDWRFLDTRNLIVWSPTRRHPYLVTLNAPLFDTIHEAIGFEDHNGDQRLCGFGMDAIVVDDGFRRRITIAGIKALDGTETGALQGLYQAFAARPAGAAATLPATPPP